MSNISDHLASIRDAVKKLGADAEKISSKYGADAEGHLRMVEAHLTALLGKEQNVAASNDPEPTVEADAEAVAGADAPVVAAAETTVPDASPTVEAPAQPAADAAK